MNLEPFIKSGHISVQKHPKADLYIYNYTQKAQYERIWTEETMACRGLILDGSGEIVARPFKKFFNLEEYTGTIPDEPFEVTEKMDGSLGILYQIDGVPYLATRGSFTSDQAIRGTAILRQKYNYSYDPTRTYLFEIIYPENRIVVDYGEMQDIILLAVIDTQTGTELPLDIPGFNTVTRYDGVRDFNTLRQDEARNKEGYVVHFLGKSNLRLKLKYEEYVRLHRLVTGVNAKTIWELLRNNQPFDDLINNVPDEFHKWVIETRDRLTSDFGRIELECRNDFKVKESRKDTALYFQSCHYPGVLFSMLDGKDYAQTIWKMIRPKAERPFREDEGAT